MQQQYQYQFSIVIFVLCSIVAISFAAPIHYDQRQEGEFNVHANLENFVIIIAPLSTISSTPQPPDSDEFSISELLEALELRKGLLAKNKFEHNGDKKIIEAIPEVSPDKQIDKYGNSDDNNDLKTKSDRKKVTDVAELTLIGDSIENCGPGRFRDQSGICQNDSSIRK